MGEKTLHVIMKLRHEKPCALWVLTSPYGSQTFFFSRRLRSFSYRGQFISHGGCVLSLTEKHRWTEHTAFHRDIKSTDNTERYSQYLSTTTHL